MTLRSWQYSEFQWVIVIALGWLWLIGPGNIEGRYLPAAAPMMLHSAVDGSDGISIQFWGQSARLRPECSFERIDWRLGSRIGQSVPIERLDLGPPELRANGVFSFGPWTVGIAPVSIFQQTYADVFHQCRVMGIELPWLTKSPFWN